MLARQRTGMEGNEREKKRDRKREREKERKREREREREREKFGCQKRGKLGNYEQYSSALAILPVPPLSALHVSEIKIEKKVFG